MKTIEKAQPWSGFFDVSPEMALNWGLEKKYATNGGIFFAVAGLIPNEFNDEVAGYVILGKFFNGFDAPFLEFRDITKRVSAVYRGNRGTGSRWFL